MAAPWIPGKRAVRQAEVAWAHTHTHTRARRRVRTAGLAREPRFARTLEAKLLGGGRGGVFQGSMRNGASGKLGSISAAGKDLGHEQDAVGFFFSMDQALCRCACTEGGGRGDSWDKSFPLSFPLLFLRDSLRFPKFEML